jgi:hypothetical protein
LEGPPNPNLLLHAAQRVPALIAQLNELVRSIEAELLALSSSLLALMLLFEHLLRTVPRVSPQPVAVSGPASRMAIRGGVTGYGTSPEATWPAPATSAPLPKGDASGIIKALFVAAAAAIGARAAGLLQANQQENERARRAADEAGLNRQGRDALHREISKKGYSQQEIEDIARELYDNYPKYRK